MTIFADKPAQSNPATHGYEQYPSPKPMNQPSSPPFTKPTSKTPFPPVL